MNKKKITIILSIILILLLALALFFYKSYTDKKEAEAKELARQEKIAEINNHYNKYVITNTDAKIYQKNNEEYTEYGQINKETKLTIEETNIDENTKYFHIPELEAYIEYQNVDKAEEYTKNNRYKNYIPFNTNIKTKEKTNLYNNEYKLIMTINKPIDAVLYVNETEYYGIEFNNELYYVKKDECETYDHTNTTEQNKNGIRTLTYHFIYDPETTECTDSICQPINQFEENLKYLSENNVFTPRLPELELYLDGKIQLPQKSIVLTIDDGTLLDQKALKLLEQYDKYATLFVITSWVDPNVYQSDHLDLESHTNNMHNQYECPGYGMQGGGILCKDESYVLEDLKTSQERVKGSVYFAYPFFDWNNRAIDLLKKAGFHMAFVGQAATDGKSYPLKTNKYTVPRKTMFSSTTQQEFISYIN